MASVVEEELELHTVFPVSQEVCKGSRCMYVLSPILSAFLYIDDLLYESAKLGDNLFVDPLAYAADVKLLAVVAYL